jgi:hypothetical protein
VVVLVVRTALAQAIAKHAARRLEHVGAKLADRSKVAPFREAQENVVTMSSTSAPGILRAKNRTRETRNPLFRASTDLGSAASAFRSGRASPT